MKKYTTPSAELVEIKTADVITVSCYDNLAEYDDTIDGSGLGWWN